MSQNYRYFVAGTDTDVGKTFVSCALLQAARTRGLQTGALKPLSAGCQPTPQGLRNSDALALMQFMTLNLSYHTVNPVALAPPIAPHIAAMHVDKELSAARLAHFCNTAMRQPADMWLVEGAGGWRVPLNGKEMLSDVAKYLKLDVILVVGMRLGCLSHALLSAEAIRRDGLNIRAWVANVIDPSMSALEENIASLNYLLQAPCLGTIPNVQDPIEAAPYLSLDPLFEVPLLDEPLFENP
ncbi:dethiobiotin synthase [Marinibactrum halimedae]|uniref:ATP-dependent dethiobiotin synthetase BioD n=1 Tax=Marinibactrum halimedae TaxID=1444977 RepID=A0AA37T2B0_9GAMM|nr:dethiobiotin synthase [Marinibactrum halimedae]MCD9458140.1 dethiobiotin synthase [Marinibactrum halimedae]GLS25073.1 ATP-dependent dethiobiotin synthetase BioD [Marinibactrum halimedae]